jgi:hypothetical protein
LRRNFWLTRMNSMIALIEDGVQELAQLEESRMHFWLADF